VLRAWVWVRGLHAQIPDRLGICRALGSIGRWVRVRCGLRRGSIELLGLFRSLRIADARCREQARKSLVSCSLNLAEGAGRRSRADKSRVYAISLGELCEAAAALEIDSVLRGKVAELSEFYAAAERLKNVISRLIR
jgi:four helix bundle protein